MRLTLSFGWLLFVGALGGACGGSSSETPWPVEPDTTALGPAGESARGAPTASAQPDAADAGPPAQPGEPPLQ